MSEKINEKKLFSRKELPFLLGLLALAALLFLIQRLAPQGSRAAVEVNGVLLETRELARLAGPELLTVQGENGIILTVEFTPEGARIQESNCPDKTCVSRGTITRAGETAICLPGRVILKIEGQGNMDAVTY